MRDKKEAPTGQAVQGRTLSTKESYHTPGPLSIEATEIIRLHNEVQHHAQTAIEKSIEIGQRLAGVKRIAKRRADMPELYRKLYDRCTSGAASPRDAVKMHCLECWGWVRSEAATCDNYACPLWRYRPYQKSAPPARQGDFTGAESTNEAGAVL